MDDLKEKNLNEKENLDESKENIKTEIDEQSKKEGIKINPSNNEKDFKKKFDEFISKKNLFEFIMTGLSGLFILNLLFLLVKIFKLKSAFNKIGGSNFESFLDPKALSGISSIVSVAKAKQYLSILIFLSIVTLALLFYKLVFVEKRKDFFRLPNNLTFVFGILCIFIGNFISRKLFLISNMAKNLLSNPLSILSGNFDYKGLENADKIPGKIYISLIFYILAILAFLVTIYILYLMIFKNKTAYSASENLVNATNSAINSGISGAENVANKVKSTDYSVVTENIKKNKKYIISGILGIIVIVIGFFGYKIVKNKLTPDAVVSLENMKIDLKIKGYDGYGVAKAEVENEPVIKEVKDKSKVDKLHDALRNYKIEYSKEKEIKNGEEVTATLKFEDTKDLNIKFDKKELTVTVKVDKLKEFVKDFKDIEKHLNRIEEDAKKSLANHYNDIKDLKIEQLAIYDMPLTQDAINAAAINEEDLGNYYKLCIVYKLTGQEKEFLSEELKPFEEVKYCKFEDFKKRGDALTYSIMREGFYNRKNLVDLENELQIKGYKKVK